MHIKKKIQHFIWRSCLEKILVGDKLRKRCIEVDETCMMCGEGKETVEHVMFHCKSAKKIWKVTPVTWDSHDK